MTDSQTNIPTYSKAEIDRSFKIISDEVLRRSKGDGTSCDDVLEYLYEHPEKIWHMSWELIGLTTKSGKYLSHRAPARASDLANFDPLLVEDRKIGRFAAYRIRWENIDLIHKRLTDKKAPPPERADIPPRPEDIKCEHGLPTYVQCPNCKAI